MANDWYVRMNGAEQGPLTSERLKQLATLGKINQSTPLKKGAAGNWVTASAVKGLFTIAVSSSESTTPSAPSHSGSVQSVSPPPILTNGPAGRAFAAGHSENPNGPAERNVDMQEAKPVVSTMAQDRVSSSSEKSKSYLPKLALVALGAFALVVVSVGATLWLAGFFSRSASQTAGQSKLEVAHNIETRTPAKPEPVAVMKEIISRINRDGAPFNGQTFIATDIAYDVRKTDSLVSPYTAKVTFHSRNSTDKPPSEIEKLLDIRVIVVLSWQDEKWVVKDVEGKHGDGNNNFPLARSEINAWWRAFGGE